MTALFVVPCKYNPVLPLVQECVRRIRKHHPDADVLVVDSASADQSYAGDVIDLGATVAFAGNMCYGIGAYDYAYDRGGYDFYYLIQDSVLLNGRLPDTFGTLRWFADPPTPWGWNEDGSSLRKWGEPVLDKMDIGCPSSYRGVFGPVWWGPADMMHDLEEVGFWRYGLPTTKWEACAMERVTGIVLEHLGYDVTQSLQGEHVDHFGKYDESVAAKVYGDRR